MRILGFYLLIGLITGIYLTIQDLRKGERVTLRFILVVIVYILFYPVLIPTIISLKRTQLYKLIMEREMAKRQKLEPKKQTTYGETGCSTPSTYDKVTYGRDMTPEDWKGFHDSETR